jgi:DNA-binding MarR family transcriptional regulator
LEDILRLTTIELVRGDNPDLTARQLGVFLICYAEPEPQTVRGMAETLNVSRPVISRALDRLSELGLVRRRVDPRDRRNVLVQRTGAGLAFLRYLRLVLQDAADQAGAVAIVRATAPWSLTAGQAAHRLPPRPPE